MVHALEIADLTCTYEGAAEPLFQQVHLTLDPHECLVITGATGVGKSTLMRAIHPNLSLNAKVDGQIHCAGDVGYVHQFPEQQFVSDVVYQELAFGLECAGMSPEIMRKRVAEIAHALSLESIFAAPTATLSGGQAQIIHVASELIRRPRVLLLDEPTAQLDPLAERMLVEVLAQIVQHMDIALLVVTHNPNAYRLCATKYAQLTADGLHPYDGQMRIRPRKRACTDTTHEVLSGEKAPKDSEQLTSRRLSASVRVAGRRGAGGATPSKATKNQEILALSHAFVRYERTKPWVLRDFCYEVAPGRIQGIIGGNGSGKTTALFALAGAAKLSLGTRHAQTSSIALLPQQVRTLFATTKVKDELFEWQTRVGYDTEEVYERAQTFGLTPLFDQHPFDISGGQMQMLGLVKLMLTHPRILLLDEPTKGLDDEACARVEDALMMLADEGYACVIAGHDRDMMARVCDEVALLFDGNITTREPTREFFADNVFLRSRVEGFGA